MPPDVNVEKSRKERWITELSVLSTVTVMHDEVTICTIYGVFRSEVHLDVIFLEIASYSNIDRRMTEE